MVKKVLRSAEKFSELLPLSPLPLYPSPNLGRKPLKLPTISFQALAWMPSGGAQQDLELRTYHWGLSGPILRDLATLSLR